MARKLAITVSGAVSLGSYEAGVLYEILYAIGQHNRHPEVAPGDRVYVDVMTGASAGGMSVCVAAQKLLYEGDSLKDPYDNPLYAAWVSDIDIAGLLAFEPGEPADCSILSSDLIEKLSAKYLLSRYAGAVPPAPEAHPAIAPDRTLQLGLALSNLNGVDYSRPTLAGDRFTYTAFQDELTLTLTPDKDAKEVWTEIQQAAVSCGAFPFAFRTKDLVRLRACYEQTEYFDPSPWNGEPSHTFTYTDGGMFQNEPLGLAKNLVDPIDQHQNSDCRAYLFVAPGARYSTANLSFHSQNANFRALGGRLLNALFNQARFQDWIEAEDVNRRIELFNTRARQLNELVADGTVQPAAIRALTGPLLLKFFANNAKIEAARDQLRKQFAPEFRDLAAARGEDAAAAWIDGILLFEQSADLHEKDEMFIYAVTAKQTELAGSQLEAFLGFFDQEYRQHDYDVGRTKAQDFLKNPNPETVKGVGPLPALQYTPLPVREINAALANSSIQSAPLAKRKAMQSVLESRVKLILREAGLDEPLSELLELFLIDKKIKQFLDL